MSEISSLKKFWKGLDHPPAWIMSLNIFFSVAKATLESHMSVWAYWSLSLLTIKPIDHWSYCSSSSSTIEPIDHRAYQPLSLSTIIPIDHQAYPSTIKPINLSSSFASFKPFGLFCRIWLHDVPLMKQTLPYLSWQYSIEVTLILPNSNLFDWGPVMWIVDYIIVIWRRIIGHTSKLYRPPSRKRYGLINKVVLH